MGGNPYLTQEIFPELEENYCRNPEGYNSKPWCYIDMKQRKWEYCRLELCESNLNLCLNTEYLCLISC